MWSFVLITPVVFLSCLLPGNRNTALCAASSQRQFASYGRLHKRYRSRRFMYSWTGQWHRHLGIPHPRSIVLCIPSPSTTFLLPFEPSFLLQLWYLHSLQFPVSRPVCMLVHSSNYCSTKFGCAYSFPEHSAHSCLRLYADKGSRCPSPLVTRGVHSSGSS